MAKLTNAQLTAQLEALRTHADRLEAQLASAQNDVTYYRSQAAALRRLSPTNHTQRSIPAAYWDYVRACKRAATGRVASYLTYADWEAQSPLNEADYASHAQQPSATR